MRGVAVQASSLESFVQLISVLVIFIFVLGVTYVATRWIAGYQKGHSLSRNLRVVETLKLSKDEVRLLTKLTEDQLKELPKDGALAEISTESFKEAFEKIKKRIPKK